MSFYIFSLYMKLCSNILKPLSFTLSNIGSLSYPRSLQQQVSSWCKPHRITSSHAAVWHTASSRAVSQSTMLLQNPPTRQHGRNAFTISASSSLQKPIVKVLIRRTVVSRGSAIYFFTSSRSFHRKSLSLASPVGPSNSIICRYQASSSQGGLI